MAGEATLGHENAPMPTTVARALVRAASALLAALGSPGFTEARVPQKAFSRQSVLEAMVRVPELTPTAT
jgi:hypothetical protein